MECHWVRIPTRSYEYFVFVSKENKFKLSFYKIGINFRRGGGTLKQEYADRLNFYQNKEYELFLRKKCVLDARQFLHSSFLYLNYALITEKLYSDIGEKNILEEDKNLFHNTIEILGWHYNVNTVLNKFTLEWIIHISNALDCILQYINSALNLEISQKNVTVSSICKKVKQDYLIENAINDLWNDEIVIYIRSVYNYSKHTISLYGNSSIADFIIGKRDIRIPDFKYKGNKYETKSICELMGYYENFIEKYVKVLDSVNSTLGEREVVPKRYHIGQIVIDGHVYGKKQLDSDIVLYGEFAADGIHIKRYWFENLNIREAEIMMPHFKTIGQHFGEISKIEIYENEKQIGMLCREGAEIENSTLQYLKYNYVEN